MIFDIPKTPFWMAMLGMVPMLWGVAETYVPAFLSITEMFSSGWFQAPYASIRFAEIVLLFMSGILWGFAARSRGTTANIGYFLAVLPVLYVYFFVAVGIGDVTVKLSVGYILVLGIDRVFHTQNLTPDWWMRLRTLQTTAMVGCLLLIGLAHRI